MSNTIGDGMAALALAGGIVGYVYIKFLTWKRKTDVIHEERMAAMEKGIPLPEFPSENKQPKYGERLVLPLLGLVLSTLAVGTMIVLYFMTSTPQPFWLTPLPFAFLGVGFLAFHFTNVEPRY